MGLRKTSSVVHYYGRAVSAGSTLSTTTRTCGGRPSPGVLYVDRGVIVLNKPPGLVSQGMSSAAVARKNHRPEMTLPRAAFDDVLLDGNRTRLFSLPH